MPNTPSVDLPRAGRLALVTLGAAELYSHGDDGPVLIFGPGKPVALLAYLSASPGRSARREHLLDLLWSDVEPDAGRHALRQLVWYIRRRAGDILIANRDSIQLGEGLDTDRDALMEAVDAQECDRVLELYRGEYLPNLALPGGGQFEQWADLERLRLRAGYLRCGDAVARRLLAGGCQRESVALARRLRDADPYSEPVWRLLIEGLLTANDYVAASSEAYALSKLLAEDEREPEPATKVLLRRASATPPDQWTLPAPTTVTAELVGRAEEFGSLVAAWGEARRKRPRHVHITGLAGLGKSRLLSEFAARLRAKGSRVVFIAVRPGDRELAQSGISDLAGALARLPGAAGISPDAARCVVALCPPLSSQFAVEPDSAQGPEGIRRRTLALHELLVTVADEAPVAVLVDDLHWMDDVSQRMLASVLERIETECVLTVTTSRPRYTVPATPRTGEIVLQPLTVAQVGALLASVGSLPGSGWAARFPEELHRATSGSPLLILETLQLLLERDLLTLASSQWSTSSSRDLMAALDAGSALAARVAHLDDADRDLLLTLAIAGLPTPVGFVAATVARGIPEVDAALATLEQRGFLLRTGEGWQPAHDTTGEVAISSASDVERRAAHRRLGDAYLAARGSDLETLLRAGRHFAAAGHAHGVRVAYVRWLSILRGAGDARPVRQLAAEFAGPDRPAGMSVDELARATPLQLRYSRRVVTWAGIAAALIAVTLLVL